MMRIFDLHADIGCALIMKRKEGHEIDFKNDHMERLRVGGIQYSAAACFFDGSQNWEDMQEMIRLTAEQVNEHSAMIRSSRDLDENGRKQLFLLTVEGMCGIDRDVRERLTWMFEQGVRMASLTWNESNALGHGSGGTSWQGLTAMGLQAVKTMEELGMILDVSHASEHTFWDILNTTSHPVVASHSNTRALCNVRRNLTDEQILAVAKRGGLIGLNSFGPFIAEQPSMRTAATLAKHARHIASLAGSACLACGFDFCDIMGSQYPQENVDLCDASMAQNLIRALSKEGFTEEEVQDIAWRNAFRFLREHLPAED